MESELAALASRVVPRAREALFVRPEDGVLVVRPNRVHFLNATAARMLDELLRQASPDAPATALRIASLYGVDRARVEGDLRDLLLAVDSLMSGRPAAPSPILKATPFGSHPRVLPILGEIALTYRCQNRCRFCYAGSPDRGAECSEMDTEAAERVIGVMAREAKIATLSFTGGEPTLREDLPALVSCARSLRVWVNLITNGIRCADHGYARGLAAAGLHSAQVSLEGADAETHDAAVGLPGAFDATLSGIRRLQEAGIRTHTNTTLHRGNAAAAPAIIDAATALGLTRVSMNLVIPTGRASGAGEIGYSDVGALIRSLRDRSAARGIRFVWYSPLPFCIFNPLAEGLGTPACAAADGLLSVSPAGDVLPCSSFADPLGSLNRRSFRQIWNGPAARYWRAKRFLPPVCAGCRYAHLCCGACPLYWDARGSFDEIAPFGRKPDVWAAALYRVRRRTFGRQKGVRPLPGGA